jgi:hypothetical protein
MALPSLAVSLARLLIDTGAPATKRKAAASTGHFGERADSAQLTVRLIAFSRVLLTRDVAVLSTVAASAHGADLLTQVLVATIRLAVVAAEGEASSTLSITNMTTLFNIMGSTLMRQSAFEGLFGLPDRISWVDARAVYTSLLDALAYVRATPEGAAIEYLLMSNATASGTSPAAVIAEFVVAVEARAIHRLNSTPRMGVGIESGRGSASSSSNRTTPAAQSPVLQAMHLPLPPPLPLLPGAIDHTKSLDANLVKLVECILRRPPPAAMLNPSELTTINNAFTEGLSVLMPTDTAVRRQELLASNVLAALTHPGMAWLWASVIEATRDQASSVDAVASNIINSCSDTAASLFAEAALGF